MSNYTKLTDFASKDALPSGNANKIVKGTEIDDEFEAIETAVNSKADLASPTLTGTPLAPTATVGTDTTQIATTAFVQDAVEKAGFVGTTQLAADAVTNAKLADDAVDSDQIADGAVDPVHLAADAVGAAAIADNAVGAAALNVSGNGTSGQVLQSDGDGSFSWADADSQLAASTVTASTGSVASSATGTASLDFGSSYANRPFIFKEGTAADAGSISSNGDGNIGYGVCNASGVGTAKIYNASGGSETYTIVGTAF